MGITIPKNAKLRQGAHKDTLCRYCTKLHDCTYKAEEYKIIDGFQCAIKCNGFIEQK